MLSLKGALQNCGHLIKQNKVFIFSLLNSSIQNNRFYISKKMLGKMIFVSILIIIGSCANWSPLDDLINSAITQHAFPGASITVANQKDVIYKANYGRLTYQHDLFELFVTNQTKWDVASITKVMVTSLNLMNMLSSSSIQLNDTVSKYIQNYDTNKKGNTTIANLLLHNAGLPYDYPGTLPETENQFLDYIRFIKPVYPIGSKFQYSNLGYYLLGKIIEKVTKKTLDKYFQQNKIFAGFKDSGFNPPKTDFYKIAPCQYDSQIRKYIVRGQAHQRVAYKYGGVAGHSGLFTNAQDLTRFIRIMLNKGKLPESVTRVIPEAVVQKFTTKVQGLSYQNNRAYGFDTVCPGTKFANCFRHDGSTGIMAFADKDKKIIVTLMSNRGHPDVKNALVEKYKDKIADTIYQILGL